ncbi:MAG: hypothetical protein QOF98_3600 [Streptomyces sp.]|nr:hypothetical protein [Streptomyces sp.]
MKLAVRRTYFGDRLCFPDVIPDKLLDVRAAYARQLVQSGTHRDYALLRSQAEIQGDLPSLLQADPYLSVVRRVLDGVLTGIDSGDLGDGEGCSWSYERELLGPPVGNPRTMWGMMANYPRKRRDTAPPASSAAAASGPPKPQGDPRKNALGCLKAPGSLTGPYDELRYPDLCQQVDPEMELAVVIGRRSRHLNPDTAMDAVAGYVGFCDSGSRDVGALDNNRLGRAKGFDTFSIVGPWFVTADEIPDPHDLRIKFWVNGELRQDGTTADMFHRIPDQLSWLTAALTLVPGDVLSTGTPDGVSHVYPGDKLRGEIDGLGVIENTVVRETAAEEPKTA